MRLRADRREERRREATERQQNWQLLSVSEKLKALAARPGLSARQVAKFKKLAEKGA